MRYARTATPHLFSGIVAIVVVATVLFAGQMVAIHVEHTTVSSTAPELFPLKTQGVVFQRAAAHARDILPVYGSSELVLPLKERAANFFCTEPTGFQVSPIGNRGMGLLVIVEKIAALGSDLRGKKLAISLSPDWFLTPNPRWHAYEGNFSLMAASEIAFGTGLDFELKQKIASRMLGCPSTVENSPLLQFALERLASGRWFDRVALCAVWPIGKVLNALMELQDHFAALDHIRQIKPAYRHSDVPDWTRLIANTSRSKAVGQVEKVARQDEQMTPGYRDTAFQIRMNAAPGWMDLDLLLRILADVHARPLLLSMPLDGHFDDQAGISRSAREGYYQKLRALAQHYNFTLIEFEEHDEDPAFLLHHTDHLTPRGWLFYNRALDDFFHGRGPRS